VTKRTARFLLFSLSVLILGTAWIKPLNDGGKSLTGEIINGSDGSRVNEQLQVSLTVYSEESEVRTYETASDRVGFFTFSRIELNSGDLIIAETEYLGVNYYSDEVLYVSNQDLPELEIFIYDKTNNPDAIRISRYDILINRVGNQLRIGEYYLISNQGELTWIGESNLEIGRLSTLEFVLPDAAQNLWFSGEGLGERYIDLGQSFVDTKAVPPGEGTVEVFFSYEVPFSDTVELFRKNKFPIDEVEIMVSEASAVTVTGEKIKSAGTIETDMGTAFAFSADVIQPNETLSLSVTETEDSSGGSVSREVLIGILILGAAIISVYWFWRRPGVNRLPENNKQLLERIAELDQAYESGILGEESYHQQRKQLKEKIKQQLRNQK